MIRLKLIFIFHFIAVFALSQTDIKVGYIISNNNDTIRGILQNHDYFRTKIIKISINNLTYKYPRRNIKVIQLGDISYIRSDISEWTKAYFIKEISTSIFFISYLSPGRIIERYWYSLRGSKANSINFNT